MVNTRTWAAALIAGLITLGSVAEAATPADTANVIECAKARALPSAVTAAQRTQLDAIVAKLRAGDVEGAGALWREFGAHYFTRANVGNARLLERWLVLQGVLEASTELALAADQARFAAEQKQEQDTLLRNLRAARLALTSPTATRAVSTITLTPTFSKGAPAVASRPTVTVSAAQLDALVTQAQARLDSLNSMSEEMSLRLQMAMDRRSKIISTLSNILKKLSQTSDTIVSNIK